MKKTLKALGVVAAASIAAALVGCIPGEETIDVKTSEIVKAVNGEIGWANVSLTVSNVYENVALSAYPESALNLRDGEVHYSCNPKEGEFSPTNRLADALGYMAGRLNKCLPPFFGKDESVRLSVATVGTNAVLRIDASLKVPIGKRAVLEAADLPRVMQLAIDEEKWSVCGVPSTSAASRFLTVANLLQRNLAAIGYHKDKEEKAGPPALEMELLLYSLVQASFADKININQEADVASSYALNVRYEVKDGISFSHLSISGEGIAGEDGETR